MLLPETWLAFHRVFKSCKHVTQPFMPKMQQMQFRFDSLALQTIPRDPEALSQDVRSLERKAPPEFVPLPTGVGQWLQDSLNDLGFLGLGHNRWNSLPQDGQALEMVERSTLQDTSATTRTQRRNQTS